MADDGYIPLTGTGHAASRERMLERIAGVRALAEEAFTRLYGYRERAEAAEAKLSAIVAHIEAAAAEASAALPMRVRPKNVRVNGGDVLAIINGEEAGNG